MSTRLAAPVVSAATVATLILGVTLAVRGGDDTSPRPLSLAGAGTAEMAAAPVAGIAADSAARSSGSGGSGVTLEGQLPAEPDEARAYDLRDGATAAAVGRLADALGIDVEPTRADGRWSAVDGDRRLDVEPNGYWSFYPSAPACGGPDSPVSSGRPYDSCLQIDPAPAADAGSGSAGAGSAGSTATMTAECPPNARCVMPPATPEPATEPAPEPAPDDSCPPESCTPGVAAPRPLPVPEPDPVPESLARDAAAPVFDAVGLRGDVSVMQAGGTAITTLNPRVDGMRTVGFTSQVEVAADGALRSGSGWLATVAGADVYPLVSAQTAYDDWAQMFAPVASECGPAESCLAAPAPAMVVTGADIGLMLTFEKDSPILVPAWLFTVRDLPEPFAQLAIDPKFLTPPDDTPRCLLPEGCTEPAPVPEPGVVEPAEPGQVEPAPGAQSAFSFDRYSVAADGVTLTIGYGESGSCPREGVNAQVKESPDSVAVVLMENTPPPDRACTADYKPMDIAVTLDAPLGKRSVVDGSNGQVVQPSQ